VSQRSTHHRGRRGVELRSTWNGRTAIAADDAKVVYERASAAAEAARQRNAVKTAEIVAAIPPIPAGKPVPPGLDGVSAFDMMKSGERDERLAKKDRVWQEMREAGFTYHKLNEEEG
jgi:hypothetical protein